MGFSLQMSSMASMVVREEDLTGLQSLLKHAGITYRDSIDPAEFEEDFFEVDRMEDEAGTKGDVYVAHPEVGWSWWSKTQEYVSRLLDGRAVHTNAIHAWYGVAVPGEIEPTMVGNESPRQMPKVSIGQLLQRLVLRKNVSPNPQLMVEMMVYKYGGPTPNLYVVSGPRLLEELRAAIRLARLESADPLQLYENMDDDNDESVARCYLVMVERFLRAGVEGGYLVWWRK